MSPASHLKNPALQDSYHIFNQDCELVSQLPTVLFMMSGSKAPDFDAYGLLRATHFHNPGIYLLNAVMFSSFKVKS